MREIFTIAAALCLFGFCVKGQTVPLKLDTTFRNDHTKDRNFVKSPAYSVIRPEPLQIPNGYAASSDKSIPIPTHKVDSVSNRVISSFRIRK
jgi:hypothetical protein